MINFLRLDHFLITIPPGSKAAARVFYGQRLQLNEIPGNHPGGAMWFTMGDIELHVREEEGAGLISARHPAFEVAGLEAAKLFLA